jgi:hypothetical protein
MREQRKKAVGGVGKCIQCSKYHPTFPHVIALRQASQHAQHMWWASSGQGIIIIIMSGQGMCSLPMLSQHWQQERGRAGACFKQCNNSESRLE